MARGETARGAGPGELVLVDHMMYGGGATLKSYRRKDIGERRDGADRAVP